MALKHGTVFSHVMYYPSTLSFVHVGITDTHFYALSFCKTEKMRCNKENPMQRVVKCSVELL